MGRGAEEVAAITGTVPRRRLMRVLDAEVNRVCVLHGPSGSGKTTVAREWAALQWEQTPLLWASLTPRHGSRREFWEHLGRRARGLQVVPNVPVHPDHEWHPQLDPVPIAAHLAGRQGPLVLVLDGYEQLGEAMPEIDADLARMLHLVPGLRIVITTRKMTVLRDLELADGAVARVLPSHELAMSPTEVAELIFSQSGITDPQLTDTVTEATGGYALGVRAVAAALAETHVNTLRPTREDCELIMGRRLVDLLNDPELGRFVQQTSIPPALDAEFATELTGDPDPVRSFDRLEARGLGHWAERHVGRRLFEYPETVRRAFRALAREDELLFTRASGLTARWLDGLGVATEQALEAAIDAADYGLADRIFLRLLIDDPRSYVSDAYLTELQRVPETELAQRPVLALGLAVALAANPLMRPQMPRIADLAAQASIHMPLIDPAIDPFAGPALRAVALRVAQRHGEAGQAALAALDGAMAVSLSSSSPHASLLGTVLRQLSLTLFLSGHIPQAQIAINHSVALLNHQAGRDFSVAQAIGMRAFTGELTAAKSFANSVRQTEWPDHLKHTALTTMSEIAEGYRLLDRFEFEAAAELMRASWHNSLALELWPLHSAITLTARQGLGQGLAVAHWLSHELAEIVPRPGMGDNIASQRLTGCHALAWLAAGDQRAAREVLERVDPHSPHVAGARVAVQLAAEHDEAALALTKELLALPGSTVRTRAELHTFGAVAAARLGRDADAIAWLDAAALAWEAHGARAHVSQLAPRDRQQLLELSRRYGHPGLVRYLGEVPAPVSAAPAKEVKLTPREMLVLNALDEFSSTRAIAEHLVVSPHTVKAQLQSIYRKLGVSSRQSALTAARELFLLGPRTRPQGPKDDTKGLSPVRNVVPEGLNT